MRDTGCEIRDARYEMRDIRVTAGNCYCQLPIAYCQLLIANCLLLIGIRIDRNHKTLHHTAIVAERDLSVRRYNPSICFQLLFSDR